VPILYKTISQNINSTIDMDENIISDNYKINKENIVIETRNVKTIRNYLHDQVRFINWVPEIAMKYTIFNLTRSQSFY
jgi:hypothetical protein